MIQTTEQARLRGKSYMGYDSFFKLRVHRNKYRDHAFKVEFVIDRLRPSTRTTIFAKIPEFSFSKRPQKDDEILRIFQTVWDESRLKPFERGRFITAPFGGEIYYQQPGLSRKPNPALLRYLALLINSYPKILGLEGRATPYLSPISTNDDHVLQPVAIQLQEEIGRLTAHLAHEREITHLICPNCLVRFAEIEVKPTRFKSIEMYGCRACGQNKTFEVFTGEIICVLDTNNVQLRKGKARSWTMHRRVSVSHQKPIRWSEDPVEINWFEQQRLFDFDKVHILRATDELVERFAMNIGNDTDAFRQANYPQIVCQINPANQLSENTLRILRKTFGEVISG
ncbi:MAG: hypothetical protein AAF485_17010 [Chloroflexota bacterium]